MISTIIRPPSARRGSDLSAQGVRKIGTIEQNDVKRAMVAGKRRLGRIHAARQHSSAAGFRELDRGDPNDARGAGDEHGLAGSETAPLEQCKVRRLETEA
jgi:hypothetical protein